MNTTSSAGSSSGALWALLEDTGLFAPDHQERALVWDGPCGSIRLCFGPLGDLLRIEEDEVREETAASILAAVAATVGAEDWRDVGWMVRELAQRGAIGSDGPIASDEDLTDLRRPPPTTPASLLEVARLQEAPIRGHLEAAAAALREAEDLAEEYLVELFELRSRITAAAPRLAAEVIGRSHPPLRDHCEALRRCYPFDAPETEEDSP